MKYIEITADQRTPEWYEARNGKITASLMPNLINLKTKTLKSGKTPENELYRAAADGLTHLSTGSYIEQPDPLKWGTLCEAYARDLYQKLNPTFEVKEVGFLQSLEYTNIGVSPDALVNDNGLLEIKCPTSKRYLEIFESGDISDYMPQVLTQLLVTGRDWCDLFFYDPRMPSGYTYFIKRIEMTPELYDVYSKLIGELSNKLSDRNNKIFDKFEAYKKIKPSHYLEAEQEIKKSFILSSGLGEYVLTRDDTTDMQQETTHIRTIRDLAIEKLERDQEFNKEVKDSLKQLHELTLLNLKNS